MSRRHRRYSSFKTCYDPCGVNPLLKATITFDQKSYFHCEK